MRVWYVFALQTAFVSCQTPFLSLPVFSRWNPFILGLFLLCELFTHNMMDDEVILLRQRCNTEIIFNTPHIQLKKLPHVSRSSFPILRLPVSMSPVPALICLFYMHVNGTISSESLKHNVMRVINWVNEFKDLWCQVWITLYSVFIPCFRRCAAVSQSLFKEGNLSSKAANSISKSLRGVQSSRCQENRRPSSFWILICPTRSST